MGQNEQQILLAAKLHLHNLCVLYCAIDFKIQHWDGAHDLVSKLLILIRMVDRDIYRIYRLIF